MQPVTSQTVSAESTLDALTAVLRFKGMPEPVVFDGCERAINAVYWTMLVCTLPFAVWEHLILNYTLIGWLHVLVPSLYLPVALGWYPRRASSRFIAGGIALSLVGLSINALYHWETQPGIYVMVPPAMVAFALYGGRAMAIVTALQMVPVIITCLMFNPNSPVTGVFIGCTTWIAVNIAGAILISRVLVSSRERADELEFLSERLLESEERLQENDRSMRHIVQVGLHEIEAATADIEVELDDASIKPEALARIHSAMGKLRNSAT